MAELISEPPVETQTPALSGKAQSALGIQTAPLLDRYAGLGAQREKAQSEFDTASSGLQGKIATERAAAEGLKPPKPVNPTEFKYQGMSEQELGDSMKMMFTFAALGGLMTRAPMTAALNAFSGGVKGLVQGDQIVYQRSKDEFDRNFKVAIEKNAEARQEYQDAFAKHKGNMQDLMNEWTIIAKKHGDTTSAINMERQDIQGQLRHIETMGKMNLEMKKIDERFSREDRRIAETERANRVREAGKDWDLFLRERGLDIKEQAAGAKTVTADEGKARFSQSLDKLESFYKTLSELGGAVDTKAGAVDNIVNRVAASSAGQIAGSALGTEAQSERNKIAQLRPLLIIELKNATGMSAQQLNSNMELQTFLNAATDPRLDIQANMEAIKSLRRIAEKMPKAAPGIPKEPAAAAGGGFADPDKERRYQEWKARQGSQ